MELSNSLSSRWAEEEESSVLGRRGKKKMGNKKVVLTGVGIAFGTIVVIGSLLAGFLFPILVINKLQYELIVDKAEPNDKSFQHWVNDNYSDAAPYYKVFTLFNLTNYNQVQASGAKPIYESVGPYYYRRFETKLNYSFFDDGKKVSYSTYEPLFYEPDLGNTLLNPYTDMIYNINPTYVGLIVAAGGEENLVQALVAPTWAEIMDNINSEAGYLGLVIDQYFIQYLLQNEASLVAEIGGDQQTAFAEFLSIWANATEDPTDLAGFNSTMRLSVNGVSSGISLNTSAMLFDMDVPLSLVSTNPVGFQTWFAAEQGDPTSIGAIQATFSDLTADQFNLIISWRNRFKPTYYNSLSEFFGVANVSDLGYYQWGMANVTTVDIATYMQAFVPLPVTPEFAIWAQAGAQGLVFTVDQTKEFLTGPNTLLNATNYFTFITLLSQGNFATIQEVWGLDQMQATALYGYIQSIIITVYVEQATLDPAFAAGGGLITWHTVDEWLWTCVDPLLLILNPSNPACNLFTNDTSEAEAAANNKASTYWTGKSDIDKIVEYINYEGETTIDIWEEPEEIGGTDASQFAPGVKTSDTLQAFVSDLERVVDIVYEKKVDVKGISLYRYVLADYMLAVDPVYYQYISGFANMSSDNAGAPIFLSKPNFLDCDEFWADQVVGVQPNEEYDTTIDVEPISGITMQVHKRLQLNVYYSNSTQFLELFSQFNPDMTEGLFYPVVWVDETSEITSKQADDFKSQVLTPLYAFKITFFVGTAIGGILIVAFVAGLVYLVKYSKQRQTYTYAPLGTPM